ncbi:Histone-lysine N-methyltransferase [Coemansia interrupta]|uniref:Histone-lysine N-methyltransferase n=1 Tax=Coemansia interrupta TaxID=1126814 RepID=A0A9W8LI82_9FUNG|nr:Histone-lysine N-methyltransferase [Coemansia interrupta]
MENDFLSDQDIVQSAQLSDDEKRELLSQRFARMASNGDLNALEQMWETCQGSKWVDIDYRDDQGSTPLICVSCFGHTHIAELLLSNGANVNSQDNSGWTALMWATSSHNEDLVRVLLEHGASSSAKTARGHTAINIASSNLSSGSDSDANSRISGTSPSNSEAALAMGMPSRRGNHTPTGSDADSFGVAGAEGAGDAGGLVVGSPRSGDQSSVGTPGKRSNGRDSMSAGQSVLSMLQASSAKSSRHATTDGSDSNAGRESRTRSASKSPLAAAVVTAEDGLQMVLGDETEPNSRAASSDDAGNADSSLSGRLRALTTDKSESSDVYTNIDATSDNGDEQDEPLPFDWDTLQLDQMYVISPATVPQFLHAVVKDIRPERWIQSTVLPEHRFVSASMIFLAARFAHHLGAPDFLDTFLTDTIASIIHEVQTHKSDPINLAFWITNIQTLVYFLKRDSTLVQITSDAQGRMSECMQDAYALLIKAVETEIEPLIDSSLLAYDSMPELFADVKFETEKSQRLSMFFFGNQADSSRKSSDGRPLRRSQTLLHQPKEGRGRRGSLLSSTKPQPATGAPATASGNVPAWIACVERLRSGSDMSSLPYDHGAANIHKRPSSGDTYVSGRSSHDSPRASLSTAGLFSNPTPRTVLYVVESLLDLLEMCEIHPTIVWGVMRQMFCYLGGEMFNRVLTTRDFCSRSRAMSIRINLSQLSDWVRANGKRLIPPQSAATKANMAGGETDGASAETPTEASFPSAETLLFKNYFDPLVELLELLQCLTHLPDLAEYFETTSKMQSLNILQQETVVANYRYEVQEKRIDSEVVSYLESISKEIREGQRAEREKQSIERASRRSTASAFTERRTMDGRPSLFSFDMGTTGSRGAGGLVRFSAEPVVNAGLASDISAYAERAANGSSSREASLNIPMSRLSSESVGQSPSISSGMVSILPPSTGQPASGSATPGAGAGPAASSRGRTGSTRGARRGLLLPIARSGSTAGNRPSARGLFSGPTTAGPTGGVGSTSTSLGNTRLSESLEPISETSSVMSRQRSHTTIDTRAWE